MWDDGIPLAGIVLIEGSEESSGKLDMSNIFNEGQVDK